MKYILRFVFLIALLPFMANAGSVTIQLDKAGEITKKLIGLEEVTELVVTGKMNQPDLKAIGQKLRKIECLDLRGVEFEQYFDEYDEEGYYPTNCFPAGINGVKTLKHLILPAGLKSVSAWALAGCTGLETLTIQTLIPPAIDYYTLTTEAVYEKCKLFVPTEAVDAYKAKKNEGWGFVVVEAIPVDLSWENPSVEFFVNTGKLSFTIHTHNPGLEITVLYPDGLIERKYSSDLTGSAAFLYTIDVSKVEDNQNMPVRIIASGIKTFSSQASGITVMKFLDCPDLQDISIRFQPLKSLDLSKFSKLKSLNLGGCADLTEILLPKSCNSLERLIAPNTKVAGIDLSKAGMLKELDLTAVGLSAVNLEHLPYLEHLSVADNQLSEIDLQILDKLTTVNVSNNRLTTFAVTGMKLEELNISQNRICEINFSGLSRIGSFDCSGNAFTLATLPEKGTKISAYLYAPQAALELPGKADVGEVIDLSAYNMLTGILKSPVKSSIKWFNARTKMLLLAEADYTSDGEGRFTFLHAVPDSVYCEISTAAFPLFKGAKAYRSTRMAINLPLQANLVFYTDEVKQSFSVRTSPNTKVRILFPDNTVKEEESDEEYGIARFAHTIDKAAIADPLRMKVAIFCPGLKSFTAQQTGITNIEFSHCPDLARLALKHQKISALNLIEVPNLTELYIDGNVNLTSVQLKGLASLQWLNVSNIPGLRELDLKAVPALTHLFAFNTKLSNLDISPCKQLQELDLTNTGTSTLDVALHTNLRRLLLADNTLSKLETENLDKLTELDVSDNNLSELLLSAPSLATLNISGNQFRQMDLSKVPALTTYCCEGNEFTLATLPSLNPKQTYYRYAPQHPMTLSAKVFTTDEVIDLSSQATVTGILTSAAVSRFTWHNAKTGAMLTEGDDYRQITDGVFLFSASMADSVHCVVSTAAFPDFTGEKAFRTAPVLIVQGNSTQKLAKVSLLSLTRDGSGLSVISETEGVYALYAIDGRIIRHGRIYLGSNRLYLPDGGHYVLTFSAGKFTETLKL